MLRLRRDDACFARARMSCSVSRTGSGGAAAGISSDIGGSLLARLVDLTEQRFPDVRVQLEEVFGEPELFDLAGPFQRNLEDVIHRRRASAELEELAGQA